MQNKTHRPPKHILLIAPLLLTVFLAACGPDQSATSDNNAGGDIGDAPAAADEAPPADTEEEAGTTGVEPIFRNPQELLENYPPPEDTLIDTDKTYTATIVTEKGDINLNLFAGLVPITVNNFIYLACLGYYDSTTFHRVIPDFMSQAGDPTGTGSGAPGYRFNDEFHPDLRHDRPGILSMANSGANTNGSQFFITHVPTPHLDGLHTVFGEVADDSSMLRVLNTRIRDPQSDPNPGDVIITIKIQENSQQFC